MRKDRTSLRSGTCHQGWSSGKETTNIAQAVLRAAEAVGRGKNRLVGNLTYLARRHPKSFFPLLRDVLAVQGMTAEAIEPVIRYKTTEELVATLRQIYPEMRFSLLEGGPEQAEFPQDAEEKQPNKAEAVVLAAQAVGEDGRGKNGLVGYLTYVARRHPKSFLALRLDVLVLQGMTTEASNAAPERYETTEELQAKLRAHGVSLSLRQIDYGNSPPCRTKM
jgi:hypothetical protein